MVGGGLAPPEKFISSNDKMLRTGVSWVDLAVETIDADNNVIETEDGSKYSYEHLIIAAGVQNHYEKVKGLFEALEDPKAPVATIYHPRYAQKWSRIRENFDGKNAVFTQPPLPFRCPGAPQKIMHLSHDTWTQKKKLNPNISFYTATPFIFAQPDYAKTLKKIADDKQMAVNYQHNLVEVRLPERIAVFRDTKEEKNVEVPFDVLHATPPQGPRPFLAKTKSIVDANGYVDVDPNTFRSKRYQNVWALGDCSNTPNAKTAAAVFEQTPILINNLLNASSKKETSTPTAEYGGYTSCPLFVGNGKLLLAEFKYGFALDETFKPFQSKPRKLFYYFKTHLFPFVYFNLMPYGRWFGRHGIFKPSPKALNEQK